MNTNDYLRINEIKSYLYCPRLPYYTLCLRIERSTDLSLGGIRAEKQTKDRMKRRKQALHAVHEGERLFDVELVSHTHRLIGRIDEIVQTAEGVYLVDYKDTTHDHGYWKTQMAAYQMAAVEMSMQVVQCAIYTIPSKTYHPLTMGTRDMQRVIEIAKALRHMLQDEFCPPAVTQIGKCRSCQYQNFCGDVL